MNRYRPHQRFNAVDDLPAVIGIGIVNAKPGELAQVLLKQLGMAFMNRFLGIFAR